MTELEFLKAESGITDDEWKAMEAVSGSQKILVAVKKAIGLSDQALKDKVSAENERLAFERRYQDEFVPEMRKVTQDAVRAQGEAARMAAQLKTAREYGIVPEETAAAQEAPRAPGSPDPNAVSRDDMGRFGAAFTSDVITLNDLNAEHFRLFGQPLGDTQALVDERQRQRTLGHKNFSLKQAWETKHNVAQKRDEIATQAKQKEKDEWTKQVLKEEREKNGANPGLRSGVPSKYATYKQSDATKEPWKAPHTKTQANKPWRDKAIAIVREAAA